MWGRGKRRDNDSQGRLEWEVRVMAALHVAKDLPFLISNLGYFRKKKTNKNICDSPLLRGASDSTQARYLHGSQDGE